MEEYEKNISAFKGAKIICRCCEVRVLHKEDQAIDFEAVD
jgi:hypothetical protein